MIKKRYALSCVPDEVKGRIVSFSLLLAVILLPGLSHAQTARSDSLYSLGMEAFARKDYKKAERLFRLTWEEDSLTMPAASMRSGYSRDWLNHTLFLLGREKEAFDDDSTPDVVPLDRRRTVQLDTLYNEARRYYEEATPSAMLLSEMRYSSLLREMEREFGPDNYQLGAMYLMVSSIYLQNGKASEAYDLARTGTDIVSKHDTRRKPYRVFLPLAESAREMMARRYEPSFVAASKAREYCVGNMRYIPYQYAQALELFAGGCNTANDTVSLWSAVDAAEREFMGLPDHHKANCLDVLLTVLDIRKSYWRFEGMRPLIDAGYKGCAIYEEKGIEAWGAKARIMEYEAAFEEGNGNYDRALQVVEEEVAMLAGRGMDPSEYVQSLLVRMKILMGKGDMPRAIEEGLALDGILSDPDDYRSRDLKFSVNMYLGECLLMEEDPLRSMEYYRNAEKIMLKINDFAPYEKAAVYHSIASSANRADRQDVFFSYLRKVRDEYDRNGLDRLDSRYFDTCLNLADASSTDDPSEPEKTFAFLETIIEEGRDSHDGAAVAVQESSLLIMKAKHIYARGNAEESAVLCERAVSLMENAGLDVPHFYYELWANSLEGSNDRDRIRPVNERMLAAAAKAGRNSSDYADALIYAATDYVVEGDFDKSREMLLEAKSILMKQTGIRHTPRFNSIMQKLSMALSGVMMPESAMEVIEFMEDNRTKRGWKWICADCWDMNKLECLAQLQKKDEATALYTELRDNVGNHADVASDVASVWSRLGSVAFRMGLITESSACYEKAIASMPPKEEWTQQHIMSLVPYLTLLSQTGEADRQKELSLAVLDRMGAEFADDPVFATLAIPPVFMSVVENEGEEGGRRFLDEKIRETFDKYGMLAPQTALVLELATAFEKSLGTVDRCYDYCKDYYEALRGNVKSVTNLHASPLMGFAESASARGKYDEAIDALDLIRNTSTIQFSDIDRIKLNSAYGALYNSIGKADKGYESYQKAFGLARDYVLDNFLTMTSEERASFWNNAFTFFRQELPSAAERGGYTPRYASLAYDAALFSSGLLLASDITVADAVEESGDRNTRRLYSDFVKQKALYEKASEATALRDDEAVRRAVELKAKAKDAEKKLLSRLSDRLGSYNRSLAIEWKDVRDALGKDEAAVEFIEMPVAQYSIYLALVLRPGYDAPVMKRLFLRDNSPSSEYTDPFEDCYNSPVLTGLLWKPLAGELRGCSSVWFAPQGKLTVTAIESLPGMEEITGRSDTRYRRLTSTRELVRLDSRKQGSGATLYGDIDFALDAEGMVRASGKRDLGTREAGGGIGELPGTGEEAEYLESLLKEITGFTAANTQYLKRDKATETSFKRLSGKAPRLLHVGTHGYFASEGDVRGSEYFNRSLAGGVAPEDLAMMRSGLLFAGAEGTLYEDRVLPDNVDNGVLTAREIASLRLQGVDLTVLSACETGLGEVGSDGVFGLQRGLKKAGAGAVMMSLWKVSDDSTTALMKSFYRHWLREGMDKQGALDAAKADVRCTPGWEHPQYWAPFILLDALD